MFVFLLEHEGQLPCRGILIAQEQELSLGRKNLGGNRVFAPLDYLERKFPPRIGITRFNKVR
jgi:hypothetical protein